LVNFSNENNDQREWFKEAKRQKAVPKIPNPLGKIGAQASKPPWKTGLSNYPTDSEAGACG
jgi:hypothetical protein